MLGLGIGREYPDEIAVFRNYYSLLLDGSDQAVQVDGLAEFFDKDTGTMSVWVRPNSLSASVTFLMVAVDASNFYRLWWNHGATVIKGTIKSGGNADHVEQSYASTTFSGSTAWWHLVMTWDTSADEMKLYVNNSLKETDGIDNSGSFSASAFAVADIGKNGVLNNSYWKGYVDEVSIFDETLTAAQVSTLYNGGSPKDVEFSSLSGLIGYWRFTEGSGTSAVDESGTGNTGTLENAPTWSTTVP